MAFPTTELVADTTTHTVGDVTYVYNGIGWDIQSTKPTASSNATEFTAAAAQTEFTVNYTVSNVEVYRNGALLQTTDYVASNGTSIVIASAVENDEITVVTFDAFEVANTYTKIESDANYEPIDATILKDGDIGVTVLAPDGDGSQLTNLPAGGIGEYIDTSIAISSDGTALANDDGTANDNIGIGASALNSLVSGSNNVSIGRQAGKLSTGHFGVAIGSSASYRTTGTGNIGIGFQGGYGVTSGQYNVFAGYQTAQNALTTGSYNTGIGYQTGYNLTTGQYNVLNGYKAGYSLTTGSENVCIGRNTLADNDIGNYNIALGAYAGYNSTGGDDNTYIGHFAAANYASGSNNMVLGYGTDSSSSAVSNEITLGNSSITSLRCQVTTITSLSDERDKDNITDLDTGLDFINSLRPVRFDWNMRDGGKVGENDIGFIAQELQQAQVDNDTNINHLVMDNNPDKLEAGYGMLIAPLVQAVKELTAKVEAQQVEINTLKGN